MKKNCKLNFPALKKNRTEIITDNKEKYKLIYRHIFLEVNDQVPTNIDISIEKLELNNIIKKHRI